MSYKLVSKVCQHSILPQGDLILVNIRLRKRSVAMVEVRIFKWGLEGTYNRGDEYVKMTWNESWHWMFEVHFAGDT